MRIGLIGGLTRNGTELAKMAADAGHQLEFHSGETSGRGVDRLKCLVARSDIVIILTAINSHQAVWFTKQAVRESRRPSMVLRNCGVDVFREILTLLDWNKKQGVEAKTVIASRRGYYKYHELSGL
jgi:hypothetical protein